MKPELLESIQAAPNFLVAELAAVDSEDQQARIREVVFYSGAKVERYDWWADEYYDLSFQMGGADLSKLKASAPVLNGHSTWSAGDVIGVVESAKHDGGKYTAGLRFSDADDVTPIWQRIQEGVLRAVSMGVKIGRLVLAEENKKTGRKHYMATDWTPYEISVVPIGADPGAKFLAADPRLEKLRKQVSASTGAASNADEEAARYALSLRQRRARVLGF